MRRTVAFTLFTFLLQALVVHSTPVAQATAAPLERPSGRLEGGEVEFTESNESGPDDFTIHPSIKNPKGSNVIYVGGSRWRKRDDGDGEPEPLTQEEEDAIGATISKLSGVIFVGGSRWWKRDD
ncbi:hypothetical protein MMC21_007076 [Puttea exsequens]|nr:hypothetical protein [Puttea exsequens]